MKKATIKEQAEKLIHAYGDAAYQKAQEAVRDARRHRNSRLERYRAEVAREIARAAGAAKPIRAEAVRPQDASQPAPH